MPMRMPALAIIVLVGSCMQAPAQIQCLEFPRLARAAGPPRVCASYDRLSVAWGETLRYARDNHESCNISELSLRQFERRYEALLKERDNVCSGRPARGFPAERILRR
jgi:hypothetical protein